MSDHSQPMIDVEQIDDPEMGSTWFLTLASVIIFTVVVLALSVMYFDFESGEVEEKIVGAPVKALEELRLSQLEVLTELGRYQIEDADGNTIERVRIPISTAMELELADAKARAAAEAKEALATR